MAKQTFCWVYQNELKYEPANLSRFPQILLIWRRLCLMPMLINSEMATVNVITSHQFSYSSFTLTESITKPIRKTACKFF